MRRLLVSSTVSFIAQSCQFGAFVVVSLIVEPSHRCDLRDRTLSFSPTDVNQEVYGAPDVRHDGPVW